MFLSSRLKSITSGRVMPEVRLLLKLAAIAATSRSTRIFYDRTAPFYDLLFSDHLSHVRAMAAALGEQCPSGHKKVLDIACGTGVLSRQLEEKGYRVTGLDFSFQSLCRLNQITSNIRLVQADATSLPFASAAFDVVTCMGAWRHSPNSEGVLQEICRVLRPDGIFSVGYFPPKLGGLFRVPRGLPGRAMVSLYGWFIRILGYSDRTDQELERETLRMIDRMFAKYRLIQSGKTEYLI